MTLQIFDPKYGCKVDGCDRQRQSRGWCPAHYNQWRTTGETPSRPFTVAGRFYKYVDKQGDEDCWTWTGTVKKSGYGQFWANGKPDRAHRVSYEISKGPIPEGMLVRHTCDNRVCVNPNHLLVGTVADNSRDAVERHRMPRGSKNGTAKLTEQQVTEVRRGWVDGLTQVEMARHYGVSKSAVQWVLYGRSWVGLGELA